MDKFKLFRAHRHQYCDDARGKVVRVDSEAYNLILDAAYTQGHTVKEVVTQAVLYAFSNKGEW